MKTTVKLHVGDILYRGAKAKRWEISGTDGTDRDRLTLMDGSYQLASWLPPFDFELSSQPRPGGPAEFSNEDVLALAAL